MIMNKVLAIAFMLSGLGYYEYLAMTTVMAGDTFNLYITARVLGGGFDTVFWQNVQPYPLYMLFPIQAGKAIGAELAIRIYPVILTVIYIAGMYLLCRKMKFTGTQTITAMMVASLPILPPYHGFVMIKPQYIYLLTTLQVAMFLPMLLALYIHTIEKKVPSVYFIGVMMFLPILHAQITQAVFIMLGFSALIYRRDDDIAGLNAKAIIVLATMGIYWFIQVNYSGIPGRYLEHTVNAVASQSGIVEEYTYSIWEEHWLDIIATVAGLAVMIFALVRNYGNRIVRLFTFTALLFIVLYFMYMFRVTDEARWLTMRMYPFIFPLVIVLIVPTVLRIIGRIRR